MSNVFRPNRWPLIQHPVVIGFALILLVVLVKIVAAVHDVFILGFLAILLAILLCYPVNTLSHIMPRALAVIATILLLIGIMGGIGVLVIPPVSGQIKSLTNQVPEAAERLERLFSLVTKTSAISQLPQGQQIEQRLRDRVAKLTESLLSQAIPAAVNVVTAVWTAIIILILSAFIAYRPWIYRDGLRCLIPKQHELVFDELWNKISTELSHWLLGILAAMFSMGLVTGIGLFIAGINSWFMLAILTFFGTFIPYVGAIASAIPGLIIGLAQSPVHFLYALLVYFCVHLIEGYLVEPLIMKKAVKLRPAVLLFTQIFMGSLFGILGIVIATPLLVCVKVAATYLYVERKLGKTC